MRRTAGWMFGCLALLMAGCPDDDTNCTTIAAVSVSVTVIDADGLAVDALVSYEANGEAAVGCDHHADVYLCGYEVAGDIEIHVEAEGYQDHDEIVTVTEDVCHVNGRSIEVVLQPLDCTDEEVPSVLAFVVDADGQLIPDASVEYAPRDELWTAPEPCEPLGGGSGFVCGYEMDGIIDLWAEAPGFLSAIGEVEVGADECHVITEEYTFDLELSE